MLKGANIDLHDLPRKVLIDLIKQLTANDPEDQETVRKKIEQADKDREETSDMHASRGKPPEIPVGEDDLPEGFKDKEEKARIKTRRKKTNGFWTEARRTTKTR